MKTAFEDRLRNLYSVDDLGDDLLCGHVLRLRLVSQADTVAEDLIAYSPDILGDNISPAPDESERFRSHRQGNTCPGGSSE